MDSEKIYRILRSRFSNQDYILKNSFIFAWESDFFCISKTGYVTEIEVKVSRADFFNDFKKKEKHYYLSNGSGFIPNKFIYAVPNGLVNKSEVPEYAGLIYCFNFSLMVVKNAPFLHKKKYLEDIKMNSILLNKFHYKSLNMERRIRQLEG